MNTTWQPAHPNNYMVGRQGNAIRFIIIHTIVGTLDSCKVTFQNPNRKASAHYGEGWDDREFNFVKETDTAYHAGNWVINLQSVGIEHEDKGDYNGVRPDKLYANSAFRVANLCKLYNIPCTREFIRKHSEVSLTGTACPDALDINRIITEAQALLQTPPPTPPTPPSYDFVSETGKVKVNSVSGLNVRKAPVTTAKIVATVPNGTVMDYIGYVTNGESVNNNRKWFKNVFGNYFSAEFTQPIEQPIPQPPTPQPEPIPPTPEPQPDPTPEPPQPTPEPPVEPEPTPQPNPEPTPVPEPPKPNGWQIILAIIKKLIDAILKW